jgi:hypothetical protein
MYYPINCNFPTVHEIKMHKDTQHIIGCSTTMRMALSELLNIITIIFNYFFQIDEAKDADVNAKLIGPKYRSRHISDPWLQ